METWLSTLVVLFIVIDPIGLVPMFMALTHGMEEPRRRKIALQGILLATVILVTFFLIGDALLKTIGIGLQAFRITGGILLFLLAIDMVFARHSGLRSTTSREQAEAEHKQDITVFPLAFPLIAGPGALTTVLLMASSWKTPADFTVMVLLLLAVLVVSLVSLRYASVLMSLLGETGSNVISRLFGLLLAALAVQYVIDGIRASL